MTMQKRGLPTNSPNQWFGRNRVNIPGYKDVIWQPLYDSFTLAAAGVAQQRLFQNPIGQQGKTLADTNMEIGGQIPKGQAFKVTGVEVVLQVGVDVNAGTAADDVKAFYESGALRLEIGSKDFIRQAPLQRFPSTTRIDGFAATTQTTTDFVFAYNTGREFSIADLLLESNQNFNVELTEIAALPSGVDATVFVFLNGYLARNSQ